MSTPCDPCIALVNCLPFFPDFIESVSPNVLYTSPASNVSVVCPNGNTSVVALDAGVVSYNLNFALGNPPYPNITLYCQGGTISVPVPSTTNQVQLTALVQGMLQTCMNQIAMAIGCPSGIFYNTQQTLNLCQTSPNTYTDVKGALPGGVSIVGGGTSGASGLQIAAGAIQSTLSVSDANAKALLLLNEIYSTANVSCGSS